MDNLSKGGIDLSAAPSVLHQFCNIFGDHISGAKTVLGGLADPKREKTQWYCKNFSIGRFRMECEHGHKGQNMQLCEAHLRQFGDQKVKFCPTCNADPEKHHRCNLKIVPIS